MSARRCGKDHIAPLPHDSFAFNHCNRDTSHCIIFRSRPSQNRHFLLVIHQFSSLKWQKRVKEGIPAHRIGLGFHIPGYLVHTWYTNTSGTSVTWPSFCCSVSSISSSIFLLRSRRNQQRRTPLAKKIKNSSTSIKYQQDTSTTCKPITYTISIPHVVVYVSVNTSVIVRVYFHRNPAMKRKTSVCTS